MELKVEINGLDKLVRAFKKTPEQVKRKLDLAVQKAARDVTVSAKREHRFQSRTGMLERSINSMFDEFRATVYINDVSAPYGKWVHSGTDPHKIEPKNKKVLRWPSGGSFVYCSRAVKHPGTDPDEFLYNALESNRDNIQAMFNRYVNKAIKEAGL